MSQAVGRTILAYHRTWRHINAENQIVGRLATNIAALLMGKHKPIYDPASDCGDHVVVTNAKYLLMTGQKTEDKVYYKHSGRPGHLQVIPLQRAIEKKGTGDILRRAVKGMLPKNKLQQPRLARLTIYEDRQAGPPMRQVLKRYDNILVGKKNSTTEEVPAPLLRDPICLTKVRRQDDTPPLGSLGGILPRAMARPKVKPPKVKKEKPQPINMKIFDEEGREWGRPLWIKKLQPEDVVTK